MVPQIPLSTVSRDVLSCRRKRMMDEQLGSLREIEKFLTEPTILKKLSFLMSHQFFLHTLEKIIS